MPESSGSGRVKVSSYGRCTSCRNTGDSESSKSSQSLDFPPPLPLPPGVTEEHLRRYFEKIQESEGFDIDGVELPDNVPLSGLIRKAKLLSCAEFDDQYFDMARKALEWYNAKEGHKFKLIKVEKLNYHGCAGFINYITMKATDDDTRVDSPLTFRAKYWEGIGFDEVLSCEPVQGEGKFA